MGMKKDKLIQQKLNQYADGLKLSPAIIEDALVEVRRNRARPAARSSHRGLLAFGAMAAAAAVILAFAIGVINNIFNENAGPGGAQYALFDLGRRSIELAQIPEVNESISYLQLEEMSSECSLFFDRKTKEAVMVYAKYKVLGAGGADEIVLIADLRRGYKELNHFKSLSAREIGGKEVRAIQFYEDGEYHTNAYFSKEDIDYYLIVMSPWSDQGYYYLEILLGF
jgi:hypothetical protein